MSGRKREGGREEERSEREGWEREEHRRAVVEVAEGLERDRGGMRAGLG